ALSILATNSLLCGGLSEHDAPDNWKALSPREEIRPTFEFKKDGGPSGSGSFVIRTDQREGLDGHWEKTFVIKGGEYYRFHALRRMENVTSPRRSALARILWRDAQDRPVRRDEPGATSYAPNQAPLAEPEYPTEGQSGTNGWTELSDVYRAPSKASKAIVELYLRW